MASQNTNDIEKERFDISEITGEDGDPMPFFERRKTRGRTTGGTLDKNTAEKLKSFFARNTEAIEREASILNQSAAASQNEAAAQAVAEVEQIADKYDVFSPDVRSTRWQEFLSLLQSGENSEQFDKFKKSAQGIRGSNKAFTLAVTKPNNEGGFSTLH
eukprot:GDKJ01020495.1.p1 GENE.GDKJ01020495.1~~GDKJ01020495.1.p1  ORF type:complete len:159 (+),score=46.65 GDKJ01020495.1:57-533(+)